jgi:multidrug transporter EmrE-like cation transporter
MLSSPLLLLFLGGVTLTIADIIMKKWVESENLPAFWLGMLIYMVAMAFLAHSFKQKNMAVASMIFVIFNVVTLAIASHILFHEKLSLQQIVGIAVGFVSIAILELPKT